MTRSRQVFQSIAAAVALLVLLMPVGCAEKADESAETATIAPATPEPNSDVNDDPALTQTIDPGENRSPYEGGPLEDGEVVGGETSTVEPPASEDGVDG